MPRPVSCCGTGPRPPVPEAGFIALACKRPQGMTTGPCAFWQGRWWSWGWRPPCPTRESATGSKKRSQAVAEAGVVHPQGERGVCGPHGGLDLLTPNGRWSASMDLHPIAGRYPATHARPAGAPQAGLRIPWRHVAVAGLRPSDALLDEAYPEVEVVRVVLDNLNTHRAAHGPLARRIAQRLEFHYTPKHGSWLRHGGNRVQRAVPLRLRLRLSDEATPAGGSGPGHRAQMLPKPASTGGSTPTHEPNSTASIPSIPNMTDY